MTLNNIKIINKINKLTLSNAFPQFLLLFRPTETTDAWSKAEFLSDQFPNCGDNAYLTKLQLKNNDNVEMGWEYTCAVPEELPMTCTQEEEWDLSGDLVLGTYRIWSD